MSATVSSETISTTATMRVRPINFADLAALEQLAVVAGGSMSSLPANRDHLSQMIGATQRSLRSEVIEPTDQSYHFVLENTATGQIVGVAGITAAVGLSSPFYSYRIDQLVHASSDLQIHNKVDALHLCQDLTGYSSLCSLFLAPDHRTDANLNLLSRARLLFIASHRQRFADRTLVELQGVQDNDGKSPLWEALGRHFFSMDYARANYLTGIQRKSFIAELMPHYPVYVPLLPESAQAVIGQPRPDIAPVVALLKREGFEHRGHVDIFDGGPTLELATDQIRSLQQCRVQPVQTIVIPTVATANQPLLVSNTGLQQFRCLQAELDPDQPQLTPALAEQLGVASGDPLQLLAL